VVRNPTEWQFRVSTRRIGRMLLPNDADPVWLGAGMMLVVTASAVLLETYQLSGGAPRV